MSLVLVTGAAGNVASRIVKRLATRGVPVRAFVRPGQRTFFGSGVEVFEGELANAARVRTAVAGVSKIYLLSAGTETTALEANVTDAAKAAGVGHIVKHSVQGAQYEAAIIPRWHRASEKRIEASGVPYTFLRPGSFASNALTWAGMVKSGDTVYGALGEAALPVIDPDDIAAVAEKVLTEDGYVGKALELTGPKALTSAEQVAILGNVIGKPLKYVNVPDEAAQKSMLEIGMPPAYVDAMMDLIKTLRGLGLVAATPTVAEVLGRPAHSFEDFLKSNVAAFR